MQDVERRLYVTDSLISLILSTTGLNLPDPYFTY